MNYVNHSKNIFSVTLVPISLFAFKNIADKVWEWAGNETAVLDRFKKEIIPSLNSIAEQVIVNGNFDVLVEYLKSIELGGILSSSNTLDESLLFIL